MANSFATPAMAAGYATSRPPLHANILKRVQRVYGGRTFVRALDVGCGAGLSTKALECLASHAIGIEPAEAMLKWGKTVAPASAFIVASADAIPLAAAAVDLITAAGSLNYVNLDRFFPEAARVLAPGGALVVYDFRTGQSFRDSAALDAWFSEFVRRYPWPRTEGRDLSPEILTQLNCGFRVTSSDHFDLGLTLTPEFYLDYVLTETNVAFAIRKGNSYDEIRAWCASTLRPVWTAQPHEVVFRGYFACMEPGVY